MPTQSTVLNNGVSPLPRRSRAGTAVDGVHLHVGVVQQPQEGAHGDPTLPGCRHRWRLLPLKKLGWLIELYGKLI